MSSVSDRLDSIQARLDSAAPGAITITPSDVSWLLETARKQDVSLSAAKEVAARLAAAQPQPGDGLEYASGRTSAFRIAAIRISDALEVAK